MGREKGVLCANCRVDYRLDQLCENCEAKAAAETAASANPSLKKRIRRAAHNAKIKLGGSKPAADMAMSICGSGEEKNKAATAAAGSANAQATLLGLHYDHTVAGPPPVMGLTVADANLLQAADAHAKRDSWVVRKLARRPDGHSFGGLTPMDGSRAIDEPRSSHDTATTAQTQVFTPRGSSDNGQSDHTEATNITTWPVQAEQSAPLALPRFTLPRRASYSSSINDDSDDSASLYSQDDSASVYSQ
ncbi:hypothetical protein CDD82_480 [Ophiocordyceps australis]|uniref:Uncharacterized protein n=1 Tax=Ophiocordyceps australis TaxID=1399860 RepID=A0A2C5YIG9_9HYPO|nr:hypothetical protein CDD82_480 [Ophiocordyceps australis]